MGEGKFINTFIELISSIAKRPAMYQVSNVEGIYLFMFGYINGNGSEILNIFHQEFRVFVNEHFKEDFTSKKDLDWPRLIRFYSGSDKHSIELFANLFGQFKDSFLKEHKLESDIIRQ